MVVTLPAVATLAACSRGDDTSGARDSATQSVANATPRDTSITLVDDLGDTVRLAGPARHIISLIPSATETVIALGAADRIVGRTRYDVAPEVASAPLVGGGIDPSIETIVALHPDLVLAWANEKRRDVPNKLEALGVRVFTLRTEDTTDVYRNITNIGALIAKDSIAGEMTTRLRQELDALRQSVASAPKPRVMYVMFSDPPMTTNAKTFIGQLIGLAGATNVFDDVTTLWPTVSMEEIVRRAPELIVLPQGEARSNTVEAMRKRAGWRDVRAVRDNRITIVDANLLNRPGPHMAEAARQLRDAFHPELATSPAAGARRDSTPSPQAVRDTASIAPTRRPRSR